jgi:hypothetical protein
MLLSISHFVNIVYSCFVIMYCCNSICYLYTIAFTKVIRNKDICDTFNTFFVNVANDIGKDVIFDGNSHPSILKISAKMATIMAAMAAIFKSHLKMAAIAAIMVEWPPFLNRICQLGKIVRMAAIFKMSAKTHQNFKVLQYQRKLIFKRFST